MTLPDLTGVTDPKERVRLSKRRQSMLGDPLGIKSGAYGRRSKSDVGDLTPERLAKVGPNFIFEEVKTPAGAETGDRHRLIVSCLDRLASRSAITDEERTAARRYQNVACLDEADITAAIKRRYGEWRKGNRAAMQPAEWLVAERQRCAEVRERTPRNLQDVLRWIEREAWDDVGLDDLAAIYAPQLSRDRARAQSLGVLRAVLYGVAEVWGISAVREVRT